MASRSPPPFVPDTPLHFRMLLVILFLRLFPFTISFLPFSFCCPPRSSLLGSYLDLDGDKIGVRHSPCTSREEACVFVPRLFFGIAASACQCRGRARQAFTVDPTLTHPSCSLQPFPPRLPPSLVVLKPCASWPHPTSQRSSPATVCCLVAGALLLLSISRAPLVRNRVCSV